MKKYLIKSEHYVYKLNEDGSEGRNVNYYEMSGEVRGNTVEEAVKNYIENILLFTYNKEYFEIGLNSKNEIIFNNIVDKYNDEDKNGKYSSVNFLYIYEIVEVDLENEFRKKFIYRYVKEDIKTDEIYLDILKIIDAISPKDAIDKIVEKYFIEEPNIEYSNDSVTINIDNISHKIEIFECVKSNLN